MSRRNAAAQASEQNYELHTLGWKAFQHLCVSVMGEMWGQTVQGFFDSNDGGRDGAFFGTWTTRGGEALTGAFTAQCKFSSRPDRQFALKDVKDELAKAERLAARGLCDNYILFTNLRLTGRVDEELKRLFEAIPGVRHFAAYGADRITQFIRESPRLRMLVPRVYGLGDLSQILDERAYDQAQEILSSLGDDLAKFVITNAYQSAAKALVEHGFVLLLGEPACGKSAIAAALALGAVDEWGCSTLKIRDADDFVRHSNPKEPRQFFWVDDAFGPTQLDWQAAVDWNRAFPHIRAAMRRGAKFVFTSRDYVYRNARSFLKESALPVFAESQVIIQVERLSKDEREQILYNHIRLGTQPTDFKREIKPFLPDVAALQRFGPEIARRLGHPAFTKNLSLSMYGLKRFVEQPVALLEEIIRTMDQASRAAIALVFMRAGALQSPLSLSQDEERALMLLGATLADIRVALSALEGSLLILTKQSGASWWRFKHPTIRDAYGNLVAADRELLDIYLAGTPVDRLMSEVTCGNVDWEGTHVTVPTERYDVVIDRVIAYQSQAREYRQSVYRFLTIRCDRDFLARYIERNPALWNELMVMSYFYAIADIRFLGRLYEFGLLPETERLRHVETVRDLAASTPDAGYLDPKIVGFITSEERADITRHVREELLSDLGYCINSWRDNWDGHENPKDYFRMLADVLREYDDVLTFDAEAVSWIDDARTKINAAIEDMEQQVSDEPDNSFDYRQHSSVPSAEAERSTFDDVDE